MDLLNHLRTFMDIADSGSLAAAASLRRVAASTVTASLQRLEDHVGAQLILRTTRSLTLTPEGRALLDRSRRIVAEVDDMLDHVSATGPLRGVIRLTSIVDFGRGRLSSVIDEFLEIHPGVRFDMSLSDAVVDLNSGQYDLAIRTGPLADSNFKARLIVRGGRSICASPLYWRQRGKPERPEDLAVHNCLVLSRDGAPQNNWHFAEGDRTFSVHVSGDRASNDASLLRLWAVRDRGVVLKSDSDVMDDLAAGRLETALEGYRLTEVNIYAVHPAGRQPSRRVAAFIDFMAARLLGTAAAGAGATGREPSKQTRAASTGFQAK